MTQPPLRPPGWHSDQSARRRWLIMTSATKRDAAALSGALEGAERLAEALSQAGEQIHVLRDPSLAKAMDAIKQANDENARNEGTLVVYFVGHSSVQRGDPVLLMMDSPRRSAALDLRDLHDLLGGPGQRVLILDTDGISGADLTQVAQVPGTAVLCAPYRGKASVSDGKSHEFASWLARGIETGEADLDGDGRIDISELYRYAADGLAQDTSLTNNTLQRPTLLLNGDPTEFVLARNPRPSRRRSLKQKMAERLPPSIEPFIDRKSQMEALRSLLEQPSESGRKGPLIVVLAGGPGMGKTQLALRVARSVRHRYPGGVLYASASSPRAAVAEFAAALGYRGREAKGELASFLRATTAELAILFVLDDADPEGLDVEELLPVGPASTVLVITRSSSGIMRLPGSHTVSVEPLDTEASLDLLAEYAKVSGVEITPRLAALVEEHGSPLYVRLLSMLGETQEPGSALPESLDDALRALYERLPPPVAALFRRASLAEAEGLLDAELAAILIDGMDQRGAIDALLQSGLLIQLPDGRVDFVHRQIREYAAARLDADDDPAEIEALRENVRRWVLVNRHFQPEPRIARDFWTTDDRLDYAPYADAIASFIRYRDTRPPLTIGIKAPWGAGKTSLMRMIQKRLDPPAGPDHMACRIRFTRKSRTELRAWGGRGAKVDPDRPVTTIEVLHQATHTGSADTAAPPRLRAELGDDAPAGLSDEWRATVWFNPWIYQSSEQVWAGLGHEIIRQITSRLPIGDRERFWLQLNIARLDRDAVRRRAYRAVWERILPFLLVFAAAAVVSLALLAVAWLTGAGWVKTVANIGAVSGAGIAVAGGLGRAISFLSEAASGPFTSVVRGPDLVSSAHGFARKEFKGGYEQLIPDPGYGTKLGFLHLVQADMKRVLDLVATEERPLVVFVDDLDRCSPGTVAQVIEAINLFLAGEFPNCVFVLAMEPALVAAHVEVTYKDLVTALKQGRMPGEWSTLGWRFLEKIVQLPLSLPPPQVMRGSEAYVLSLLNLDSPDDTAQASRPLEPDRAAEGDVGIGSADTGTGSTRDSSANTRENGRGGSTGESAEERSFDPQLADQLADAMRGRRPNVTTLPDVARLVQAELVPAADPNALLPETVHAVDRVFAELYSDADAVNAIVAVLPALASANPREIKRYVNLFRFYTFIVQRQRLLGISAPSGESIAKLAALAIRWPHLLSALGQRVPDGERTMSLLERAARATGATESDLWRTVLGKAGLLTAETGSKVERLPEWSFDLRAFLATGPEIGETAGRLL